MYVINSTDVRKEFSSMMDKVIREKPLFVKRTRDHMVMTESNMMVSILELYKFSAQKLSEEDGSVTLSLNEIDLIENGKTEEEVMTALATSILEYAKEYYNAFDKFYSAPNRKSHLPYVLKVLLMDDIQKIKEQIQCQNGKS